MESSTNEWLDTSLVMVTSLTFVLIHVFRREIINLAQSYLKKPSKRILELRTKIKELNKEIKTVPIVDQFPRYAKIERQLKTLRYELEEKEANKPVELMFVKMVLNLVYAVIIIFFFVHSFWYKEIVVMELIFEWVEPLPNVFSFPVNSPGVVTLPTFIFFAYMTISSLKIALKK